MHFIYTAIKYKHFRGIQPGKKCVKHSSFLYSGPFLKPLKVVFHMHLYTLEHNNNKNSVSGQKIDLQVPLYQIYHPKMDTTAFQIQPNETENRLYLLCSTQAELLVVPPTTTLRIHSCTVSAVLPQQKSCYIVKLIAIMRQQQKNPLRLFSCLLFFSSSQWTNDDSNTSNVEKAEKGSF